jgi:hypothetical protein
MRDQDKLGEYYVFWSADAEVATRRHRVLSAEDSMTLSINYGDV